MSVVFLACIMGVDLKLKIFIFFSFIWNVVSAHLDVMFCGTVGNF